MSVASCQLASNYESASTATAVLQTTCKISRNMTPKNTIGTNTEPFDRFMRKAGSWSAIDDVDDGLTSLSWLQTLTAGRLGLGRVGGDISAGPLAPPTPPASPALVLSSICFQAPHANKSTLQATLSSKKCSVKKSRSKAANSATLKTSGKSPKRKKKPKNKIPLPSVDSATDENQQIVADEVVVKGEEVEVEAEVAKEPQIDYKVDGTVKPPFSYATLICMAMQANGKMTLSAIYKWIRENFLYYQLADPSWQNSIRHNLSLNKCFIKMARSKEEPGKGGFWRLDDEVARDLVDGVFKRRRPAALLLSTSATRPLPDNKKHKKPKKKVVKEETGSPETAEVPLEASPSHSAYAHPYFQSDMNETSVAVSGITGQLHSSPSSCLVGGTALQQLTAIANNSNPLSIRANSHDASNGHFYHVIDPSFGHSHTESSMNCGAGLSNSMQSLPLSLAGPLPVQVPVSVPLPSCSTLVENLSSQKQSTYILQNSVLPPPHTSYPSAASQSDPLQIMNNAISSISSISSASLQLHPPHHHQLMSQNQLVSSTNSGQVSSMASSAAAAHQHLHATHHVISGPDQGAHPVGQDICWNAILTDADLELVDGTYLLHETYFG